MNDYKMKSLQQVKMRGQSVQPCPYVLCTVFFIHDSKTIKT